MKKLFFLCVFLVLLLVGCGTKESGSKETQENENGLQENSEQMERKKDD